MNAESIKHWPSITKFYEWTYQNHQPWNSSFHSENLLSPSNWYSILTNRRHQAFLWKLSKNDDYQRLDYDALTVNAKYHLRSLRWKLRIKYEDNFFLWEPFCDRKIYFRHTIIITAVYMAWKGATEWCMLTFIYGSSVNITVIRIL